MLTEQMICIDGQNLRLHSNDGFEYVSDWLLCTDGKVWQVARYQTYYDTDAREWLHHKWHIYGPDGYHFDGVVDWVGLPALPGGERMERW